MGLKKALIYRFRYAEDAEKARNARPEELKFYDRVMIVSQALPTPRKRPSSHSLAGVSSLVSSPSLPLANEESDVGDGSSPTSPTLVLHVNALPDNVLVKIFRMIDYRQRIRVERVSKK